MLKTIASALLNLEGVAGWDYPSSIDSFGLVKTLSIALNDRTRHMLHMQRQTTHTHKVQRGKTPEK